MEAVVEFSDSHAELCIVFAAMVSDQDADLTMAVLSSGDFDVGYAQVAMDRLWAIRNLGHGVMSVEADEVWCCERTLEMARERDVLQFFATSGGELYPLDYHRELVGMWVGGSAGNLQEHIIKVRTHRIRRGLLKVSDELVDRLYRGETMEIASWLRSISDSMVRLMNQAAGQFRQTF